MREDDGKSQMDPRMREDDGKMRRHSRSVRHSCVGRNPSPYLHPAVRAIRWIHACARMTGKSAVIPAPSRHSCAEPALDLIGGGIHPRFLPNSAHSSNDLRP
jgi:hypothetical protein